MYVSDIMATESNYACSQIFRPKEKEKGGFGANCCIPNCKSRTYDRDKKRTGISLFRFPKEPVINRQWKRVINQFRRKDAGDNFTISKATVVCEFHFNPKDIKISMGQGRKSLRKGAIPSIFPFKTDKIGYKRKSPKKCLHPDKHFQ